MPIQNPPSDPVGLVPVRAGAVHAVALTHMRRRRARVGAFVSALAAGLLALAALVAWLFQTGRR